MPYPKNRKQKTPVERFWQKVKKGSSCWGWIGAISTSGYGVFQRGKRGGGLIKSHRFSYELHHGAAPKGLLVLHRCNNKLCVNPNHLYAGNHSDNILDAWRDGVRSSAKTGAFKGSLSDDAVRDIRAAYTGRRGQLAKLARKYGVTGPAIKFVVDRARHCRVT